MGRYYRLCICNGIHISVELGQHRDPGVANWCPREPFLFSHYYSLRLEMIGEIWRKVEIMAYRSLTHSDDEQDPVEDEEVDTEDSEADDDEDAEADEEDSEEEEKDTESESDDDADENDAEEDEEEIDEDSEERGLIDTILDWLFGRSEVDEEEEEEIEEEDDEFIDDAESG
jgi:hypothetical protein